MDEIKKKKKFSFLKSLGFGNKKQVSSNPVKKKDVFYVGTAEKNIRDNKNRKKKLLEQIK